MKVLVTGSEGFIGRNLLFHLKELEHEVLLFDIKDSSELLKKHVSAADFIFHLAGVNRPQNEEDFFKGNAGLTQQIQSLLEESGNQCPVVMTSSIQAALDNPYGRSKSEGEEALQAVAKINGNPVAIFRLPNVFGKWSRPNYNSAVATFCHNISRGLEIQIHDRSASLKLVHIDSVVKRELRNVRIF